MKLKSQVVSLELSKEMKELGYKQEGLWKWVKRYDKWAIEATHGSSVFVNQGEINHITIAAPTVAEMGEVLPTGYRSGKTKGNIYKCYNSHIIDDGNHMQFDDKTEANARAKMWVYLKKEGLL